MPISDKQRRDGESIVDRLEPGMGDPNGWDATTSTAISLKRIADGVSFVKAVMIGYAAASLLAAVLALIAHH